MYRSTRRRRRSPMRRRRGMVGRRRRVRALRVGYRM